MDQEINHVLPGLFEAAEEKLALTPSGFHHFDRSSVPPDLARHLQRDETLPRKNKSLKLELKKLHKETLHFILDY